MEWLVTIVVRMIVLGIVIKLVPGVTIRSIGGLFIAAILLGFANQLLLPVFAKIDLPMETVTQNLLFVIVNAVVLKMIDFVMGETFQIKGWWPAIFAAIMLSILSWVVSYLMQTLVF